MEHRVPRLHWRTAFTLALAALAAAPGFGADEKAGARTTAEYGRNFDLRLESASALAPRPEAAQARAIQQARAAQPNLLIDLDYTTGATRSVVNAAGSLTGPRRAGSVESNAVDFVAGQLDLLGLTAEDLADYEVTDAVYSEAAGATHLYLRQRHEGIPVYNGQLQVNVGDDGSIQSVHNLFVPRLAAALNTTVPDLAADDAVEALAAELGRGDFAASAPSLAILPIRPGEARLVWNFNVQTGDLQHAWDVTVDAVDGRVWTRLSWIADAQYRVYQRPVEAPTFTVPLPPADGRTLQVDPHNLTASPFGWHDTNGAAGAEFTNMRGNNVHAYDDIDNNNAPPAVEPNCGAPLNCDFPIDLTLAPNQYIPAAVANLFYWNNVIHDVAFLYGFDSPGGNFQVNTYGQGGVGNDDVRAEAQDGGGTNNANFFTPADGSRPRMQMYIWTAPTPDRDGDLDAGIVAHEYGHGISNRLVGGPANVGCLGNAEQPGEGLSDWWSLFYTHEASNPSVRGIGTYALNQPTTGPGIRGQRYDKDPEPNTNTWTYASLPGSAIPHGVGEKWAQAYWYVQGRLEDAHGFNANTYAYTGTGADAGNIRAMFYIIEGLKNAVCSPGFVDTRNGIITAVTNSYGGEDLCLVWEAFAEFGLGFSASQGSSGSINDQTPAFDLPLACSVGSVGDDASICAGTNHIQTISVGPAFTPPVTMSASGNPGATTTSFNPNPVPGPLPQNTQLTIGNTGGVAAGTYPITVTGNDGSPTPIGTFDLTVYSAAAAAPALVAPLNGTSGHPVRPQFSWNAAAGAVDYDLEVDDDADFSSPVYTATVAGTNHIAASDLPTNTPLYWRVTANNPCGSTASAVWHFAVNQGSAPIDECFDVNVPIPDNVPAGVTNNQSVAASAPITDLDVSVTMQPDHTWIGDLIFRVTKGATTVTFVDRPGVPVPGGAGCSDNLDFVRLDDEAATPIETHCPGATINGTFSPNQALSAFDGLDINGSWTLFASDNAGLDTGTIDQWCLHYSTVAEDMPFLDGFETNDTSRWTMTIP